VRVVDTLAVGRAAITATTHGVDTALPDMQVVMEVLLRPGPGGLYGGGLVPAIVAQIRHTATGPQLRFNRPWFLDHDIVVRRPAL
jgi:hypothetical protein